jgi:murein L,D-transpeptidase YcbB/YkuD
MKFSFHIFSIACICTLVLSCQDQSNIQASPEKDQSNKYSPLNNFFRSHISDSGWQKVLSGNQFSATKKFVAKTYQKRKESVWFTDHGLSKNGEDLIYMLNNIAGYGLDSSLFELDQIIESISNSNTKENKFQTEMRLTSEYMKLATYLNRGFISEKTYQPIFEIDSVKPDLSQHLLDAAEKLSIIESLHFFEPKIPEYTHLRNALLNFTQNYPMNTAVAKITPFKTDSVKCYSEAGVALSLLGYLDSISSTNDSLVCVAIKQFQKHNGLNPDGNPGKHTIKALSLSNKERVTAAQATLSKLRWSQAQNRSSYFYINIPSFTMKVVENRQYVQKHKTVVGNTWTKTPEFHAELDHFILNPKWFVPKSISSTELLGKVQKDSTYLNRNGYVVTKGKKTISSTSIDWNNITSSSFRYNISQNAGRGNALGKIKFIFPNVSNVYMHDTPSKHFFGRDIRAFSHGCIRLQNPVQLAKYIAEHQDLSVQSDSIQSKIDSQKNRKISLKKKITVYIEYYLVGTDENGIIEFYSNIYKKDLDLIAALNKNNQELIAQEL